MTGAPQALTVAAALGCGLVAGVFFAFSGFVMNGLERLAPAQGIAAMQSINRTAVGPTLMAALFGCALLCAGLVAWAAIGGGERSGWVIAGGALYLIGAIVVTIAANVPLNDALAAVDPDGPEAAGRWGRYVADWTRWNHVRTLAALAAAALLTVALM